jgi:hypothetical protein
MDSRLILGTVQLGTPYGINNRTGVPSEREAFSILDLCAERGIHVLDTAEAYGGSQGVIGRYIESSQRGRFFKILSKFKVLDGVSLLHQLEKTLGEVKTGKIYAYSFHKFEDISCVQAWIELGELKRQGLIEKIGVSIYGESDFKKALQMPEVDVIQLPFNLLDHWGRRGQLIEKAKSLGKLIHVRSVFLQGLFFRDPENFPLNLSALEGPLVALHRIAAEVGTSIGQLALRYVLSFDQIDGVLIGVETMEQLKSNLDAAKNPLQPEILSLIEKIEVVDDRLLDPRSWK